MVRSWKENFRLLALFCLVAAFLSGCQASSINLATLSEQLVPEPVQPARSDLLAQSDNNGFPEAKSVSTDGGEKPTDSALALVSSKPAASPVEQAIGQTATSKVSTNPEGPINPKPMQLSVYRPSGPIEHPRFNPMLRDPNFFERATLRKNRYAPLVEKYAKMNGVPVQLAKAVIFVESGYRVNAKGGAGEVGLMQIKPRTARGMGYSGTNAELFDPETNIRYGMKYLAEAHRRGGGSTCGTILKYNAGHYARKMNPISAKYCRRIKKIMKKI